MLKLLDEIEVGNLKLKNRIIMAPLTRNRSTTDRIPSDLNIEHYTQRAGAGLIITESTAISEQGVGYINSPGLYTTEQVKGWKKLTNSVHDEGGLIFVQLFHVGRVSHPDFLNGDAPVAPSAIKPQGQVFTPTGMQDYVTPRPLNLVEIKSIVDDFKRAAGLAKEAGFDGIEIHGANGYLINQFIDDSSNKRSDIYGGSVENRSRLLFEVLDAVLELWGSGNVGLCLSPSGVFNSVGDSNSTKTYSHIISKLNSYNLAYLHLMNPMMPIDGFPGMVSDVAGYYGSLYEGNRIVNGGYTRSSGNQAIEDGISEMVSYGHLFIANPDLPKRFELDTSLNVADPDTFYGGGAEGYTDYPFLEN